MSATALGIAAYHSRAKGTAKLVLLAIADHTTDAGAYPGVKTLKRWANVDERNVRRALRELEELGEIRTFVQGAPDARIPSWLKHNVYEFTLSCPPNCDGSGQHRDINARRIDTTPLADSGVLAPGGAGAPGSVDKSPNSSTPGGAGAPTPGASVPPLKQEIKQPQKLKKETHVIAREAKRSAAVCGHDAFVDAHGELRCYLACRTEFQLRRAAS